MGAGAGAGVAAGAGARAGAVAGAGAAAGGFVGAGAGAAAGCDDEASLVGAAGVELLHPPTTSAADTPKTIAKEREEICLTRIVKSSGEALRTLGPPMPDDYTPR